MSLERNKLTVLIPTKGRKTLKRAIDSVFSSQTSFDIDILVVSNILDEYKDDRIIFHSIKDISLGDLYYKGLKRIKTEYVFVLEDDDILYNDFILETTMKRAFNHSLDALLWRHFIPNDIESCKDFIAVNYFGVKRSKFSVVSKSFLLKSFIESYKNSFQFSDYIIKTDILMSTFDSIINEKNKMFCHNDEALFLFSLDRIELIGVLNDIGFIRNEDDEYFSKNNPALQESLDYYREAYEKKFGKDWSDKWYQENSKCLEVQAFSS